MKVRKESVLDAVAQRELARSHRELNVQESAVPQRAHEQVKQERIDISKGRLLNQLLNPELLGAERAAKIQEIKELVQSGRYFQERPLSAIAEALAEGMSEEIEIHKIFSGKPEETEEG
jgi:uncharacterized protein YfkK (UPF0435 family)